MSASRRPSGVLTVGRLSDHDDVLVFFVLALTGFTRREERAIKAGLPLIALLKGVNGRNGDGRSVRNQFPLEVASVLVINSVQ